MSDMQRGDFLGLVLFVGLFFAGFWYVSVVAHDADMSVETNITPTFTEEVGSNWLHENNSKSYSSLCQQSDDNETLYVNATDSCTWTSVDYNTTNGTLGIPQRFDYISDASSGDLEVNISTYYNSSLQESNTYALENSINSLEVREDFSKTPVDYVDVELFLDEKNNNEDQSPSIEKYELVVVEEERTENVGLTPKAAEIVTLLVFLSVGILFVSRYAGW